MLQMNHESRQEFLKKLIDRLRQQPQVPLKADGLADGLEQHLRQVVPSENATHEIPRNEASGSNDTSGRAREHQKRSKLRDELECHLREADGLICELEAIERQGRRLNQREIDRAKNPNLLRPVPIGPNRQGRLGARGRFPTRPTRPPNPAPIKLDGRLVAELSYQISSITAELGNLRDVMQGLSNTIYENTTGLEHVIASNQEILDEMQDT